MPPKHAHRSGKKPKSILKNPTREAQPLPEGEGGADPPALPPRPTVSIRSNSKNARRLLRKIKEDQNPVASFFGMARLKGSALELHTLLKEEGHVRTGESDIRRMFKGDPKTLRDLMDKDEELPEKTIQAKTEFVSINNQFNKIVVTPLERTFRSHGRSKPDYSHLRKQAELLLDQAKEARRTLKKAVKDARKRNSQDLDPDPPQFDVHAQRRRSHRRNNHGRRK